MKRTILALAATATLTGAAMANDIFTITIESLGPQPLTPVFFSAGPSGWDIFDSGGAASAAIEAIAEQGDTSLMLTDAANFGLSANNYAVTPGGPIPPGNSGTVDILGDATNRYLSFASMLPISNDAFIGSAFGPNDGMIDLYGTNSPLNGTFTISYLDVWDAGTEVNDELAANVPALGGNGSVDENGVITRPHPGIAGIGDVDPAVNWYGGDVARITISSRPVPEPATLAILGIGAGALVRRRKN